MNLQNLARCVGSTCHDGLLAPGMWDRAWRAPRGVEHPETHPHSQAVVVYAEYSSSTLTPGLQLCKECKHPALRCALIRVRQRSRLSHAGLQPLADQPQYAPIIDPLLDTRSQMAMCDGVEKSTDIRIHYPVDVALPALRPQCVQRLMWTVALPEAVGTLLKVLIEDRLHDHHHRPLDDLVLTAGCAYRPLLPTFLLDPHPFDRRRHIPMVA